MIETRNQDLERICEYLPGKLRAIVRSIGSELLHGMEEIRFNAGLPITCVFAGDDRFVGEDGTLMRNPKLAASVGAEDVEELFYRLCEHSVYAYQDDIARGFITLRGGFRAGICGKVVYRNEVVTGIKEISSVCIRISRQMVGCAENIFPHLILNCRDIHNTLIVSPPRCGKTTVLRDVCRLVSGGSARHGFEGLRTSVIDERSEIAACYRGMPQNDCGPRTDVLDGCRKSEGIGMMLRGMSPAVIVVDELGAKNDAESIRAAWNAGVRIVATVHAYGLDDLKGRPGFEWMTDKGGFGRYVLLGINKGKRWVRVTDADGNELFFHNEDAGLPDGIRRLHGDGAEVFGKAQGEAAFAHETEGYNTLP